MELPCQEQKRGSVFLWVHPENEVHFHDLEIEGVVDDVTMTKLRAAWIEDQLAEL